MSKIYGIGDEEELAEDLQKELPNKIIAELKRIKTELENPKAISMDFFDGLAYAEEIIDKHISELKGE